MKRFNWGKHKNSKLLTKTAKYIIQAILLLAIDICLALTNFSSWLFLPAGITLIFYILSVVVYASFESYKDKQTDLLKREIESYKANLQKLECDFNQKHLEKESCEITLHSIKSILEVTAKNINTLSHKILQENTIDEEIWSFRQTCTLICKEVLFILEKMHNLTNSFEVSYVADDLSSDSHKICLIAYANTTSEPPSKYEEETVVPVKVKKKTIITKYCFERILLSKDTSPLFYQNKTAIQNNFHFKDNNAKQNCRYHQYLAIPVCCSSKKIVGIMQVVSFQDNVLGKNNSIDDLVKSVLQPMAYLSLLAHKIQQCIHSLAEVKNGRNSSKNA